MNNQITGMAYSNQVRFLINDTTDVINQMASKLKTSPVATAAIGRTASITSLMGAMEKDKVEISVTINGDGPIGKIIAISDQEGHIRATCENPYVNIPKKPNGKLDVSSCVGQGHVNIVKIFNGFDPYTSQTNIIDGEIANDFAHFFVKSEQIPTAISAGVLVDVDHKVIGAGALIVQVLPNTPESVIVKLEAAFSKLGNLSAQIKDSSLKEILDNVFDEDYEILGETLVDYKCACSEEKYINAMRMLNADELESIKQDQYAQCVCSFCNTTYEIETSKI